MSNVFLLFLVMIVIISWLSPSIYRKIKAKIFAASNKISKKLSNLEEEAKLIIYEAEKELREHKMNLIGLMTSFSKLNERLNTAKEDVITCEKTAINAKEKGLINDVKTAISRKIIAEKNVENLSIEVSNTDIAIKDIQEFIRIHEERLTNARNNITNLNARQQIVNLRDDLLKNINSGGLASLDELECAVIDAEYEIKAKEVVFGSNRLEYDNNINIDLKVEEFMKS